jgi:hypothetical protein
MAEEFVNGTINDVPYEVSKIASILHQLKQLQAKSEAVWLLNDKWEPVENQDDAWIKAIIDVHYVKDGVLHLADYKSGQMYPEHLDQLELYGLIGLKMYPEVKRVETSAIYMDMNFEGNQGSILPTMAQKMITPWDKDARTMMADEVFTPKPSPFQCLRCPYSRKNNGPCIN